MLKTKEPKNKNAAYTRPFAEMPDNKIWTGVRLGSLLLALVALLIYYFYTQRTAVMYAVAGLVAAGWYPVMRAAVDLSRGVWRGGALLVDIVGLIAFCFGFYIEGVMVLILYAVSSMLRDYQSKKAWHNISPLSDLRPHFARIADETGEHRVPLSQVKIGDTLVALKDEKIAVDGVALQGGGLIDQSPLVGGNKMMPINEGAAVYCGAINAGGKLYYRASAEYDESVVERIIAWVRRSAARKAPIEILLEKCAGIVQILFGVGALLTVVLMPLVRGVPFREGVYAGLMLLMISNLGVLVESVSLGCLASISGLAEQGVLVRSNASLDQLRKIRSVIFNKTGTLTDSQFRVEEIIPHNNAGKERLLFYAATAEQTVSHGISDAIVRAAEGMSLPTPEHKLFIAGEGVCAAVGQERIFVGNEHLMRRVGVSVLPYHGQGVVCFVGVNDRYLGCIVLSDPLRNTAFGAVDGLFKLGVRSIDLVTCDREINAESVASMLGLHHVFSELTQAEKLNIVRTIKKKNRGGGTCAFVGDSLQDRDCLLEADVAFAMGALESADALDVFHVVLLSGDPAGVRAAVAQSFRTHRTITLSVALTAFSKAFWLLAAIWGFGTLWMIVLAEAIVHTVLMIHAGRCLHVE